MKSLKFKNKGINFAARLIEKGDAYGKDEQLIHEDEIPLIEFFDLRYSHSRIDSNLTGQFISRYNLDTFEKVQTGIFLDSGSIDWSLNQDSVKYVQEWARDSLDNVQVVTKKLRP